MAVQSTGCPPIVDAFNAGLDESTLVEGTHTLAFGINVPKALGDFLVLEAVRESGGTAIAVSDDDILRRAPALAAAEGAWICPEGAACMAAARELRESGWIGEQEQVVVLNTGTGLKYPETVPSTYPCWPGTARCRRTESRRRAAYCPLSTAQEIRLSRRRTSAPLPSLILM